MRDGTEYTWTYPTMFIYNISVGTQYQLYMDKIELKDLTNNLVATIHYNPYSDNTYSGMVKRGFSFMSKKKDKNKDEGAKPKRGDDVIIEIFKTIETMEKGKNA